MKLRKILSPYLNRLRLESLIRAFFSALAGGLAAAVLSMVVMWVMNLPFDFLWVFVIFAAAFLIGMLVCYLFVFHVSYRTAIHRIDASGLEARLVTMRQLRKDTSYMAECQRQDTLEHLKNLKLNDVTIHVPQMAAMVAVVAVLCATLVFFVPLRTQAVEDDPYVVDPYEEKSDIMEQLRQDIYQAAKDNPALKDFLEGLDDLLTPSPDGETDYETIDKMEDYKDKLEEMLEKNRVSQQIGQAFIAYQGYSESQQELHPDWITELTGSFTIFGNALITRQSAQVNGALDRFYNYIKTVSGDEDRAVYTEDYLAYHLKEVLAGLDMGVNSAEVPELAQAILHFAENLVAASRTPQEAGPYNHAIEQAKTEINLALFNEIQREEAIKDVIQKVEDAIDKLLPDHKDESADDPFQDPDKDPVGDQTQQPSGDDKENEDDTEEGNPSQPPNNNQGEQKPNENPDEKPEGNKPPTGGGNSPGDTNDSQDGTKDDVDFGESEGTEGDLGQFVDPVTGEAKPLTKENIQSYLDEMNDRIINDTDLTDEQKQVVRDYYDYLLGVLGTLDKDDTPEAP